jgi:hypothetical protein
MTMLAEWQAFAEAHYICEVILQMKLVKSKRRDRLELILFITRGD